ncbi:MAG: amidohydrolase [Thermovenabulum sp.]|uniref:amidohydrolase n=1 Tax=Thermovenabulum sp. TaxID=3100335 RepID=UPI003C797568
MDLILYNGKIVTMDEKMPEVEAVGIGGGKIVEIGSNEEVLSYKGKNTVIIDLKGKTVVPGFNDSHMHLLSFALSLEKADLNGCDGINELIRRVRKFIEANGIKNGEWVQGRGWNHEFFKEKRMPTRRDLDKISEEHPIILTRTCGHVAVANTYALKLAGIFENPPYVEGGSIDLDEKGTPTGILRENAMELVYKLLPMYKKDKIKEMIIKASNNFLKAGLTSVQTDDLDSIKGDFKEILEAYFELEAEKKLPIRVNEQVLLPTMEKLEAFLELGYRTGHGSEYFKIGPLKLLTDGSLGGRTAALSFPYEDDKTTRGIAIYNQEQLDELIEKAYLNGMQVACHAIGDRAMDMVFSSYDKAMKKFPKKDPRLRIIHCQITTEELIDKFKKYNVIADIQPIFVSSDLTIVEKRVGKERAKWTYNWKTLIEKGVHVAGGSDCPVEPFNPILGIYAAVTRKNLSGYPEDGWLPEQRLSVKQAVHIFTMGSAYCTYEESIKGSITPGKLADMVVLSEDIFNIVPDEIKDVGVEMTILGGKIVYTK